MALSPSSTPLTFASLFLPGGLRLRPRRGTGRAASDAPAAVSCRDDTPRQRPSQSLALQRLRSARLSRQCDDGCAAGHESSGSEVTSLVVINQPLTRISSGYHLRVWHLCRVLADHEDLVAVCVPLQVETGREYADVPLDSRQLFVEEVFIAEGALGRPSPRRHLRWRQDQFSRWAYPAFYREVVATIHACCLRHRIERIVAFGLDLAGFIWPFRGRKVLFDVCDSVVLTRSRELAHRQTAKVPERLKRGLTLERWKRTEGRLPHWFSQVSTVNDADSEVVRRLSGQAPNITTVPNGIDPRLEHFAVPEGPRRRGVVFWGNLSFPPNREAVRYFFHSVYRPYLASQGIEWCVVGRDAEPWLRDLAAADPLIRVAGYVPDVYPVASEYAVMVNPMVTGSGMKNKVLEAFALNMAVVSTPLGIESVAGAMDGRDYVAASTPEAFAHSVITLLEDDARRMMIGRHARELVLERFTWRAAGARWLDLYRNL
jgi:glycosyltransferase involved in cell wall biosynthesis